LPLLATSTAAGSRSWTIVELLAGHLKVAVAGEGDYRRVWAKQLGR
jgi:hypothetical protein